MYPFFGYSNSPAKDSTCYSGLTATLGSFWGLTGDPSGLYGAPAVCWIWQNRSRESSSQPVENQYFTNKEHKAQKGIQAIQLVHGRRERHSFLLQAPLALTLPLLSQGTHSLSPGGEGVSRAFLGWYFCWLGPTWTWCWGGSCQGSLPG